jgi:hypothetical protein
VPHGAADQLVALEQVDEAVIGELRDQDLRHVLERDADLQRAGQPLADALEQGDPVLLPLAVAPARLPGQDHHPVDVAAGVPQRHGQGPDERARPVAARALHRAFPGAAAQHLPGQVSAPAHAVVGEQAQGLHRAAGQPGYVTGDPEEPRRELVQVEEIAQPVGDDNGDIGMAQDHFSGEVGVESRVTPACHALCSPVQAALPVDMITLRPPFDTGC